MHKIEKVLLVNPSRSVYKVDCVPPLVLGYLAAWIMKNNAVEVLISDEAVGNNTLKLMDTFKPDLVGITAMTEFSSRAYEIAKASRKRGILTVMGGKHATILPEEVAEHVDIVVKGEGEIALSEIIDGNRDKFIEGTVIENIDKVSPVPWELLDMPKYLQNYETTHPIASVFWPSKLGFIMTSRGCPYSCIYCYNSGRKNKVRFMSPERIISDIIELKEKYEIESLFFIDDNLFANKKNLRRICELMIEKDLGVKWICSATVNYVTKESLEMVKKAGCVKICFGFESGSVRILNLLKKRKFTVENNLKAIALCKEVGVKIFGCFMIGTPTETKKEIQETINFIKDNTLDSVNVQITKPYPGTELWDMCQQMGLIKEGFSWDKYDSASFSDKFSYEQLSSFWVDAVNSVNKYTLKRAIQRIRHEPAVLIRALYDKRFIDIVKLIFKNMFKK